MGIIKKNIMDILIAILFLVLFLAFIAGFIESLISEDVQPQEIDPLLSLWGWYF